jgi:hypothetical protein
MDATEKRSNAGKKPAMKLTAVALIFASITATSLASTGAARAATTCTNDIDCTTGGTACGTAICNYNAGQTCTAAGQGTKGMEGWCTVDTDCKCHSQGATCAAPYCTFTTPPSSGSSSGGASGSASSGGSASGASTTGGASGASSSGGTTAPPASKSGCAMTQADATKSPWSLISVALGLCVAVTRRRRA